MPENKLGKCNFICEIKIFLLPSNLFKIFNKNNGSKIVVGSNFFLCRSLCKFELETYGSSFPEKNVHMKCAHIPKITGPVLGDSQAPKHLCIIATSVFLTQPKSPKAATSSFPWVLDPNLIVDTKSLYFSQLIYWTSSLPSQPQTNLILEICL